MITISNPIPTKFLFLCLAAYLPVVMVTACVPAMPLAAPAPVFVIETVEITQVVTRVVTFEVTQLVNKPITLTPSPTPIQAVSPSFTPTLSRTPTETPTPTPARITILVKSACLYGPGSAYLFKYGLNATVWMTVIGRNMDGSWLHIKSAYDPVSNACWIKADLVKFDTGNINDVPIVWTALPYSNLYQPPTAVSANRVGYEVTVFWQPVWMTEDDYRGYLIEAWVCQKGSLIFLPISYSTSFSQNNSMMSVKIIDEPDCDLPSNARIYSVEKHGYTDYMMINWPGFTSTATPAQ